jgi:exodeoxyribonuclease-3
MLFGHFFRTKLAKNAAARGSATFPCWTDALRRLQPEGLLRPLWTFWDYERNRRPLDEGMRLDHFLLSPTVCHQLVHGG